MPTALVVGASRGLGRALCVELLKRGDTVYGTYRSSAKDVPDGLQVIENVDASQQNAGQRIVDGLKGTKLDRVWYVAGLLVPEPSLDELDWQAQIDMITVCAIAPIFITSALVKAQSFAKGAKLLLISSEAGSIALRTPEEGGAMYGHHLSKTAENQAGRLLSIDLRKHDIPVALLHPSFMRTSMTSNAFGEEAWEQGGAIEPEQAVTKLIEFAEGFALERTGTFWAPNGGRDIGQAKNVLGQAAADSTEPLELPW